MTMDINVNPKFAKVAALMRSTTHAGEQASAKAKAEALAASDGKTLERALAELDYDTVRKANPNNPLAGFDEWQEIKYPGHKAKVAKERQVKFEAWRVRKAAAIAKYGSEDAVLEPGERERLILKATKQWRVPCKRPNQRWTDNVDGWESYCEDPPPHVRAAIEGAYPMPATYREAIEELQFWDDRNQELEDVLTDDNGYYGGDYGLDLPAVARRDLIRDWVQRDMPLNTLEDVIDRLERYRWNEGGSDHKVEDALLRDLRAIAAKLPTPPHRTPTIHRRAGQIEEVLRQDPGASDREIARRTHCSPTTVGKIRAAAGLTASTRSVHRRGQAYQMRTNRHA